ncbi:MAG TPA: ABC-F family ATP-binding cassette domain-containing protein [Myxococcota bacterium]|nr:ABC-F family ATP-binding cassette domain-containing protein [Myxococcota bacterium]
MIDLKHLSHGFLRKSLFHDANLRLLSNERYGVTGANGSGKSTLLKIIAGEIEPDDGEVEIRADASLFRIGQDHSLNDDLLIIDTAMMGQREVFDAIKQKEGILREQEAGKSDANFSHNLAALEEIIESREGYRLRPLAQAILEGLGIKTADHEEPLKILSGGYKWRVFLAQALVKRPDVLMLDEPTNHLDIVSIRWLELFLANYQGLVILVSHDKRFMDHVCTQILDIDFDTITAYPGNYSAFETARSLFLLQKEKEILAQEKEIAKKQAFIDRFRFKASKARQAQSRIKQIERMVIVEPVKSSRIHPKFKFEVPEPGSKEVLSIKHLSKSYGEKTIINDFTFDVKRGEKVAIIGPNGSGKSTLIKALAMEFSECEKFIKWGHGTTLGYFAQDCGSKIKAVDDSILEWLWQFFPDQAQSHIQSMLGRVLFTGDDAKKSTKNLSGGEMSRLYLAYLMMKKPNVLLLDEPTNHLDIEAIESLTLALCEFSGTLIFVSHDRSFIDKVALRILELGAQGISDFLGNYSEFVETKDRDYLDTVREALASKHKPARSDGGRLSYEEQKRRRAQGQKLKKDLERTMLMVEDREKKIQTIEEQFADVAFFKTCDFDQVNQMEQERSSLLKELDSLIKEWEAIEQRIAELIDE